MTPNRAQRRLEQRKMPGGGVVLPGGLGARPASPEEQLLTECVRGLQILITLSEAILRASLGYDEVDLQANLAITIPHHQFDPPEEPEEPDVNGEPSPVSAVPESVPAPASDEDSDPALS